jgi:hypothetical protein
VGFDGNEIADQLAREGSSHALIGLEPALGIFPKFAGGVRDWTIRKPEEHWHSILGQREAKGLLRRPSPKKAGELLNLSGNHLRIMTEL